MQNSNYQDINLINLLKRGNKTAFNTLFDKYYLILCEFSYLIIKNKELAEEIVADVFANIWIKRKKTGDIENVKSYLYKSTKNMTISYMRKKKIELISFEDSAHLYHTNNCNPEKRIIKQENLTQIENVLLIIPERSRLIFKMHRIDNFKYQEIAKILEISIKTVEKHIGKALKLLRDYRKKMN